MVFNPTSKFITLIGPFPTGLSAEIEGKANNVFRERFVDG